MIEGLTNGLQQNLGNVEQNGSTRPTL